MASKWLTVRDAAVELNLSEATIRRRVRAGTIASKRVQQRGRSVTMVLLPKNRKAVGNIAQAVRWFALSAAGGAVGNAAYDGIHVLIKHWPLFKKAQRLPDPPWVAAATSRLTQTLIDEGEFAAALLYVDWLQLKRDATAPFVTLLQSPSTDVVDAIRSLTKAKAPAALINVLTDLASRDLDAATRCIFAIRPGTLRDRATLAVARECCRVDAQLAFKLASSVSQTIRNRESFAGVVSALTSQEPALALELAGSVHNARASETLTAMVALHVAPGDARRARDILHTLPDRAPRRSAEREMAASFDEQDLELALASMSSLSSAEQSLRIAATARSLIWRDPDQARVAISHISDSQLRADTRVRLLAHEVARADRLPPDIDREIGPDEIRAEALPDLMRAVARHDAEVAFRLAESVRLSHPVAFPKIVRVIQSVDASRAGEMACKYAVDYPKSDGYRSVYAAVPFASQEAVSHVVAFLIGSRTSSDRKNELARSLSRTAPDECLRLLESMSTRRLELRTLAGVLEGSASTDRIASLLLSLPVSRWLSFGSEPPFEWLASEDLPAAISLLERVPLRRRSSVYFSRLLSVVSERDTEHASRLLRTIPSASARQLAAAELIEPILERGDIEGASRVLESIAFEDRASAVFAIADSLLDSDRDASLRLIGSVGHLRPATDALVDYIEHLALIDIEMAVEFSIAAQMRDEHVLELLGALAATRSLDLASRCVSRISATVDRGRALAICATVAAAAQSEGVLDLAEVVRFARPYGW